MQFNPTNKENSLIADIDFLLFGDSSTLNTEYSLTDRTRNINLALDEVVAELHKADPNYQWDDTTNTTFPVATLALTAGQDHYTLLDTALVIHRVRIKDRNGVYFTLRSRLKSEISDSDLNNTGTPHSYYKVGEAVFPVPAPNYGAANGVELSFQRGANHFSSTDTDTAPGFNSQFHHFLSIHASHRYAKAHGMSEKIRDLKVDLTEIKEAIRVHYERRSPDDRTRFRLKRSVRRYGL